MDDESLTEALSAMRNADVRRECREEGLRIARWFHPSVIVGKYIQALGFGSTVEGGSGPLSTNTKEFNESQ